MNAYRADNPSAPIRLEVNMVPEKLNPLYSAWCAEWQMLDEIYPNLISVKPYSLDVDQPWVAQDWEVDTWFDPREGINKTKVTFRLRKDVGCAEPQTGSLVDYLTTDDLAFSLWYAYAFDDAWAWDTGMDVNHIRIINNYQIEVYFESVCWT